MRKKKHRESRQKYRTLKQMFSQLAMESPGFVSLFTRVSTHPQIRLCDATGLKANYVCPRTGVQYNNAEVYMKLREMSTDTVIGISRVRAIGKDLPGAFRGK